MKTKKGESTHVNSLCMDDDCGNKLSRQTLSQTENIIRFILKVTWATYENIDIPRLICISLRA